MPSTMSTIFILHPLNRRVNTYFPHFLPPFLQPPFLHAISQVPPCVVFLPLSIRFVLKIDNIFRDFFKAPRGQSDFPKTSVKCPKIIYYVVDFPINYILWSCC